MKNKVFEVCYDWFPQAIWSEEGADLLKEQKISGSFNGSVISVHFDDKEDTNFIVSVEEPSEDGPYITEHSTVDSFDESLMMARQWLDYKEEQWINDVNSTSLW